MFKKILIANRGEIAVRIIRTCREMGIPTVAIFSTADRTSPHVLMSDEAVEIGAPPAAESYLRADTIIKAARKSLLSDETAFCSSSFCPPYSNTMPGYRLARSESCSVNSLITGPAPVMAVSTSAVMVIVRRWFFRLMEANPVLSVSRATSVNGTRWPAGVATRIDSMSAIRLRCSGGKRTMILTSSLSRCTLRASYP
ncbi:MAG: hypothetical protein IID38_03045 [Planctomycetes bacterium]|nr:hypothetical protein [Planctomycetota bacterium]